MKGFLSVKGTLVLVLLLVAALGSSTAFAGSQSGASAQQSLTRLDGATIVASERCTENESAFTIWGSGFGSEEVILLSVVVNATKSYIWFAGFVNEAGAFETAMTLKTGKPPGGFSDKAQWPGTGLMTVEAISDGGRIATTPVEFSEDCPGGGALSNYPLPATS